jgi:all-trans-retinol dehydrogenase (NAD+)
MNDLLELIFSVFVVFYDWFVSLWKTYGPLKFVSCNLRGKYVLITGAGSGIGQELSRQLAKLGCNLIIWDVNADGMETTKTMCQKENATIRILTYVVNLCNKQEIYAAANRVKAAIPNGHVDILVNNAGIVSGKSFLSISDESIERTMQVNVMAHFWTLKAFLPSMVQRNSGHIVSVASAAGLFGLPSLADYCASKYAAVGLEESIRYELWSLQNTRRANGQLTAKSEGIHSTVICPYFISSGMFSGISLKFRSLLPETTVCDAAGYIVEGILRRSNFVTFPSIVSVFYFLKPFLTCYSAWRLLHALGLTQSMDTFKGRSKPLVTEDKED